MNNLYIVNTSYDVDEVDSYIVEGPLWWWQCIPYLPYIRKGVMRIVRYEL